MDLREKRLDGSTVFNGKIIKLEHDNVLLPDGNTAMREIVRHPGGACVLPVDEDYNIVLLRQYRYAYDSVILEAPAGKIDPGEQPEAAAQRELREEAGLSADKLVHLGEMLPSVGYTDEVIYLYLAFDLAQSQQDLDEDEFVEPVRLPLTQALEMVVKNEIRDAKTQICILKASLLLSDLQDAISDK